MVKIFISFGFFFVQTAKTAKRAEFFSFHGGKVGFSRCFSIKLNKFSVKKTPAGDSAGALLLFFRLVFGQAFGVDFRDVVVLHLNDGEFDVLVNDDRVLRFLRNTP